MLNVARARPTFQGEGGRPTHVIQTFLRDDLYSLTCLNNGVVRGGHDAPIHLFNCWGSWGRVPQAIRSSIAWIFHEKTTREISGIGLFICFYKTPLQYRNDHQHHRFLMKLPGVRLCQFLHLRHLFFIDDKGGNFRPFWLSFVVPC